jgi:hypothetical protein
MGMWMQQAAGGARRGGVVVRGTPPVPPERAALALAQAAWHAGAPQGPFPAAAMP